MLSHAITLDIEILNSIYILRTYIYLEDSTLSLLNFLLLYMTNRSDPPSVALSAFIASHVYSQPFSKISEYTVILRSCISVSKECVFQSAAPMSTVGTDAYRIPHSIDLLYSRILIAIGRSILLDWKLSCVSFA